MSDTDNRHHVTVQAGPSPMIRRVQRLPRFGNLRAALEASGERVHVTGLRGTSFVLLAEALREKTGRAIVVVCPDGEGAEDTLSDFRTVSTGTPVLFPERDIFPHRYESKENLGVRGDRNECLLKIMSGHADVVVTSLLGFLEKTIPVDSLTAHRRTIHSDDTVDIVELQEQLVAMGYDRVSTVEEPGQFAVRGAIVDVFDPAWEYPARFEMFDDEVVSMRTFDLDTQRSIDMVESVTILPAASVLFEDESIAHLHEYLRARGFDGKLVAQIEDEITHSRYSFLWRRYAPALGMDGALLDFFGAPPIILFSDVAGINRMYRQHEQEIARVASQAEEDYPLLGLHDYLHAPDYFERYGVATAYRWVLSAEAERGPVALDSSPDQPPGDAGTSVIDICEPVRGGERTVMFTTASHPSVIGKIDPLVKAIRTLSAKGMEVSIYSETPTQRERLADLLDEHEQLVHLPVGWIASGFIWEEVGIAVLTDHQIFNRILARPRKRKARRRVQGIRHDHLQIGDYAVHVDYGIGRFMGLEKIGSDDGEAECLLIRFQGNDRIFVPLEQMHLVEKYVGKEGVVPRIDKLGGSRWQTTKARAKKAIEDIARELLHVYAEREMTKGYACGRDTQWQKELEAAFPFEETPHQLRATDEIKEDMMEERPMDRLVCGDVGYGKTEVAIRAAFKATTEGKQVAVLVPTTLLAFQHLNTFRERIDSFPLKIEMLSRFVSGADQKKVVAGLHDGTVDIVIGTHRLLSKDIGFRDLGLLIIDEEHRFGVKHKERLKQMTKAVDVLSLTATPIPRTLYMSLSGLRRISVIDTPPRNRHPVKTDVTAFDEETIRRAITDEVSRDGQVFFVHNRVRSILSMAAFLERLLPGVRFCVAHGQMGERELEKVIVAFMEGKYDVLVSTTIIESGLDFPNVNTILVNRADRFGLAQLYQLRGRVGRRERQAYSYFLIPRQLTLTEVAAKRLLAMEEFEELGSGYRLAMRDLEIRGAGNVLGVEQHGHVAAVGFEMYCKMLKDAVEALRGEAAEDIPQCRVESPYDCFIPESYIQDPEERMMIYKRLARVAEPVDLEGIGKELKDRFGPGPDAVRTLLDLTSVKLYAALLGVVLVRLREPGYRRRIRSQALEQAAEPPRSAAEVPGNVPKSVEGSNRLRRLAETIGGGLGNSLDSRPVATFEFGPGKALLPDQCGRLVETFGDRLLFKSGKTFGVSLDGDPPAPLLQDVKNLLQVAYFSSKINDLPDKKQGRSAGVPARRGSSGD